MLGETFQEWFQKERELQWFLPIHNFVLLRFGEWSAVLKEKSPPTFSEYALGLWHYARGVAYAKLNKSQSARKELQALIQIQEQKSNDATLGEPGNIMLSIARYTLTAVVSDQKGNVAGALRALQKAVKLQESMGYHEPPNWYLPMSEALADAYMKYGQYDKAGIWYKKAIHEFPNNPWALKGLAESYEKLGMKKQANEILIQFKRAAAYSEIENWNSTRLIARTR